MSSESAETDPQSECVLVVDTQRLEWFDPNGPEGPLHRSVVVTEPGPKALADAAKELPIGKSAPCVLALGGGYVKTRPISPPERAT